MLDVLVLLRDGYKFILDSYRYNMLSGYYPF